MMDGISIPGINDPIIDQNEDELPGILDFEKFWHTNRDEVYRDVSNLIPPHPQEQKMLSPLYVMTLRRHPELMEEEETISRDKLRNLAITDVFQREENFAKTVFQTLNEALGSEKQTLVFFDVDGTIALSDAGEYIIRPVMTRILSQCLDPLREEQQIRLGIVSTRTKESTQACFAEGGGMSSISHHFDHDLIYSCRSNNPINDRLNFVPWSVLQHSFTGDDGIMDSNLLSSAPPEMREKSVCIDDLQKTIALTEIWKQNPDKSIAIFDDITYPNYIRKDCDIYAASVNDSAFFI